MINPPSGTVTFLFTDIEGSTRLWEEHPDAMRQALAQHDSLLREAIENHGGYVFRTLGDAFFAAFANVSDAASAASDAQAAIFGESWPPETPIRVRMAISTGSAELREGDYFGIPLNRAARLLSVGHGGQILVAAATRDLLFNRFLLHDLGLHKIKDLPQAERIYELDHPSRPPNLPPIKSIGVSVHNLPRQLTAFVGREREIKEWSEVIRERTRRLFTITGFGGLGKTRVAMELGERLLLDFPDGVWWCELEQASTTEDAVTRIAQALSVQLQPSPSVKEQLFRHLRERNALLILDNLEQVSGGSGLLKDLISETKEVVSLITSRKTLELRGETVLELDPLPETESVQLFGARASEGRADFAFDDDNRKDVLELCERLEGVPLAIELAAARISGMSLHQMLQRLNERFRLLQSRSQDLSERQRALRGAIDWSYALIRDDDKQVFAQVSVFAGGFTLEDAEAVCEAFDVFEGVMALRQQSFLRVEESAGGTEQRFIMLDSLREYGAEKLAETPAEVEAVKHRHAERFLRLAQEGLAKLRTAAEQRALNQLQTCESNVRAALDWASAAGVSELAAELSLVLGVMRYRHGFVQSAAEILQTGLEQARQHPELAPNLVARLMLERAGLHYDFREGSACERLSQDALTSFEQVEEKSGMARAENLLGQAAMTDKQFSQAIAHYQRAKELFELVEDKIGVAISLNNQGVTLRRDKSGSEEDIVQRRARAGELLNEALGLRRMLEDRRGMAETLNNLGVLAFELEEYDRAWDCYLEALQYERQIDNWHGIGVALANLGEVAVLIGNAPQGARMLTAAERVLAEVGSPFMDDVRKMLDEACSTAGLSASEIAEGKNTVRGLSVVECSEWALDAATNSSSDV